jgi:protein gp37
MDPDWARSLRDECEAAGVAFHFKQTGSVLAREWGCKGKGTDPAEWPEVFPRQYPSTPANQQQTVKDRKNG